MIHCSVASERVSSPVTRPSQDRPVAKGQEFRQFAGGDDDAEPFAA